MFAVAAGATPSARDAAFFGRGEIEPTDLDVLPPPPPPPPLDEAAGAAGGTVRSPKVVKWSTVTVIVFAAVSLTGLATATHTELTSLKKYTFRSPSLIDVPSTILLLSASS